MQKFEFTDETKQYIRHNLVPDMLIKIIFNRDDDDLDLFDDIFDLIEFRGHEIIAKWVDYDEDEHDIDDFSHVRSILRKAIKWYKSQVYIERHTPPRQPTEANGRYALSQSADKSGWVCLDADFGLLISWRDKAFNDTQQVENLGEINPDEMMAFARVLREMGDWLSVNHRDKI
ncbi:hypothetical protein D9M68_551430 [compost metagenome]